MIYLLDTNAFTDIMREHPRMIARLEGLPTDDRVVICSIVRGEILYGINRLSPGKRQQDLSSKAENIFAALLCEPVPEAAADHYASVKNTRLKKGLSMDENDLWIAATALHVGACLVTRDHDMQQIDGLIVADWTTP